MSLVNGVGLQPTLNNQAQAKIAIVVNACSIAYLIYLLTAKTSPQFGEWAGPPHLSSSALLAIALSTILSRYILSNTLLGWWTIVTSTLFIFSFECLQLLTPNRSFQFIDIAEGIAGAAIAAMVAVTISGVIGRNAYVWLAIGVVVSVLIASLLLLRVDEPELEVSCAQPVNAQLKWDLVTINTFIPQADETVVSTSIGPLCFFDNNPKQRIIHLGEAKPRSTAKGHSLILDGSGLISAELTGLREALSLSKEITFGVRFKADNLEAGRPPRLIASIQSIEQPRPQPQSIVARLIQNGPNATAAFGFQPWQGSSTVLANRLKNEYHEIVLTYDGSVQTTYFDGTVVGTETTDIAAIDVSGGELILNVGKRADRRWRPFIGNIEAIIIGAKSLSAEEIATIFD